MVGNKVRELDVPKPSFKSLLKKLHKLIQSWNIFHSSAHGSIRRHSPQTSAKPHCGKKYLFTTDVRNCFPSTTTDMLFLELSRSQFCTETSVLLSRLLTVHGHVPQGAATSSDAINLLFRRIDGIIWSLCKQNGFVYTRYVDDCNISGNDGRIGKMIVERLESEISSLGLCTNPTKSKCYIQGGDQQRVQGLSVYHKSGTAINKDKEREVQKLALEYIQKCKEYTVASDAEIKRLRVKLTGHLAYFRSANFNKCKHLRKLIRCGDRRKKERMQYEVKPEFPCPE